MKLKSVLFSWIILTSCLLSGCASTTANSGSFTQVGSWTGSLDEEITSVYIDGETLYATAGYKGLLVFDVSDPAHITNIGRYPAVTSLPVSTPYNDVVIRTVSTVTYAYVASGLGGGSGGIEVLNVTNPTNIVTTVVSTNVAGANPISLRVSDDGASAYTADALLGYKPYAVNISGAAITPGATLSLGGKTPSAIALNGTAAYMPAKDNGFFVVDTSAGSLSAQIIGSLLDARSASFSMNVLVIGDRGKGVSFYDVTSPTQPSLIATYSGSKYPTDLFLYGDDLFASDEEAGLLKIKRTPPDTFEIEKQSTNATNILKIQYQSSTGLIFAACGVDGIRIYR